MAYAVKYIGGKHLDEVQGEWIALQKGNEMTMFQSYQWYQMLQDHYVPADTREYESVYAVVESDGKPCIIAPLWIVKKTFGIINQKGVYLLGRCSFSDYLNMIYQHFDECAFDYLLNDLSQRYKVKYFFFENFVESTSAYRHIRDSYNICRNSEYPCVGLSLPSSVEEYQKLLSKNSRQNLRTANNRLKKDGKNLIFNFDNQQIDRNYCMQVRESKLIAKYNDFPLMLKFKYRILNRFRYHFPSCTPISNYSEGKVMTASDDNGKLWAFFNYGYDPDGTCIRVMAAGTNLDFAYYSPGMLLMYNFILKVIQEGKIKEIDFTRGDEKYKFSLGGQQRLIHTIKFKIK
jgi:CelD/BcsL family acetyltransferase involved in cellulose biosynthesis